MKHLALLTMGMMLLAWDISHEPRPETLESQLARCNCPRRDRDKDKDQDKDKDSAKDALMLARVCNILNAQH